MLKNFLKIVSLCLLLANLCACEEKQAPAGVLATVNGEPITLLAAQSLLDARSAAAGVPARPSAEDMKKNYARALSTLIAHTLVRQELADRKMAVDPANVDAAIAELDNYYGPGGLEKFLDDASMRIAEWRQQMLDHLSLETFKNEILMPGISVSLDEIRDYYKNHEYDFQLPDNCRLCFLSARNSKAITDWCVDMDSQKLFPELEVECLYATTGDVPPDWQKAVQSMKAGTCLPPRENDGEWHSVALLEREKGKKMNIVQAYALIENIIIEKKRQAAFDNWLQKKIEASRIMIRPELADALRQPSGMPDETGPENRDS